MGENLEKILGEIRGSIIVSCQALPDEPLYCEEMSLMPFMAKAAKMAGCKCIRTSSVRDVIAIKKETGLPVIGLIKRAYEGYDAYITPTMQEVDELMAAEADIIALDCTMRTRDDGKTVNAFIAEIKAKYPQAILMADISTYEEGVNAEKCGGIMEQPVILDKIRQRSSFYIMPSFSHVQLLQASLGNKAALYGIRHLAER